MAPIGSTFLRLSDYMTHEVRYNSHRALCQRLAIGPHGLILAITPRVGTMTPTLHMRKLTLWRQFAGKAARLADI